MGAVVACFVIALGFVTAGLIYSANTAVRRGPLEISIAGYGIASLMGSFLLCMVTGPYVVFERGVSFWREGAIPTTLLTACVVISLLWSFCLGVFVAQMLIGLGVIEA